ncbi:MAG TPA: glycerol-3-phosphate dehydrogenase/oxidase [Gemmatimonadaceae bacterium]|nr:glycerol-3-phosphate dehydrogenase/oxidase [Gemmatimonadaceae bacterium]
MKAPPPPPPLSRARALRAARLDRLRTEQFDVLVIGGGITGAGVARDAAMRGLRTALVERGDYASGTSSRSSRLVHGGVRYLEHGHLHLVFESSRERRTLLRIAPHLVRPLAFTWPVYAGARIPRWKLGAGLMLYDALAMFRNVGRHHRLGARAVLEREPALAVDGLRGGATYFDASTDDSRLTLANILAAEEAGAAVTNHAVVIGMTGERRQAGTSSTVHVRDARTGTMFELRATVVVNATGPWSDEIRHLADGSDDDGHTVRGTKGVHIAVPASRVGNRGALTLLSPVDGRVMFVLPSESTTIVGTTDTPTDAHPRDVRASREDVRYLLDAVNRFFPAASLGAGDVIASWAGIRPLVAAGFGSDPSSASREHAIVRTDAGMVHVTGGKLTTYRSMAAEVVDEVERALGRVPERSPTDTVPLPGGDTPSMTAQVAAAGDAVGDAAIATHLVHRYGTRWRQVHAMMVADPSLARPVADGLPWLRVELAWAVEHEQACDIADVLIRRTQVAFDTTDHGAAAASVAADVLTPLLRWDNAMRDRELDAFANAMERMFSPA